MKTIQPSSLTSSITLQTLKARILSQEEIRILFLIWIRTREAAKNIAGLLLFLDFEKAFDTIEWPFIRKTSQYFGFGGSILKWLNLFHWYTESCVLNNSWTSHFFEIQRGVRQGCPLLLICLFCRLKW